MKAFSKLITLQIFIQFHYSLGTKSLSEKILMNLIILLCYALFLFPTYEHKYPGFYNIFTIPLNMEKNVIFLFIFISNRPILFQGYMNRTTDKNKLLDLIVFKILHNFVNYQDIIN